MHCISEQVLPAAQASVVHADCMLIACWLHLWASAPRRAGFGGACWLHADCML